MKTIKLVALVVAFCFLFSCCAIPENVIQVSSEVDFSVPQKVQISYNEHIYDSVIVLKNGKAEINFRNEKDLMNGAYVSITLNEYKISYNNMIFEGNTKKLSNSFLPHIIYSFFSSFEDGIMLDSFDKEKNCHYTKRIINNFFVVLEAYEKDGITNFSMEIK